jgi:hypothetical protein
LIPSGIGKLEAFEAVLSKVRELTGDSGQHGVVSDPSCTDWTQIPYLKAAGDDSW